MKELRVIMCDVTSLLFLKNRFEKRLPENKFSALYYIDLRQLNILSTIAI